MAQKINTIPLPMPVHMGLVNAYLIDTPGGQLLIDTGSSNAREERTGHTQAVRPIGYNMKYLIINKDRRALKHIHKDTILKTPRKSENENLQRCQ